MPQNIDLKDLKRSFSESIARGQLGEARRIYEQEVLPSAAPPDLKTTLLTKLLRAGGWEPKAERELSGAAASPLFLAMAEAAKGRPEEALAILEAAADRGSPSPRAKELRIELLNHLGRRDEALAMARRLSADHPERASHAWLVISLLTMAGRFDEVAVELMPALRKWPTNGQLLWPLHRLPLPRPVFDQLYAVVKHNFRRHEFKPHAKEMFALLALKSGEIETACEVLAGEQQTPDAMLLRKVLTIWPAATWRDRARIVDDPTLTIQQVAHPGAKATLIHFTALYNNFAKMPLSHLDALLADFPINIIYLRDTNLCSFFDGVPGLGADAEETAAALAKRVSGLGAERILTIGVSSGGFAAVRYGALLDARAVLTFASPTALQLRDERTGEARADFSVLGLDRYSLEARDILPDVRDHPSMTVTQYIAADNYEDGRQAARIEGLPNVRTRRFPGLWTHGGLVQRMIASGEFQGVMADWLAEAGAL